MLFSYFISCWINWWVYAAQFLDCFVVLLTPCIQQRQQRRKTQHNKELESDRDREKGTTEKNNVKLCKAEMTQSSKWSTRTNLHFFCCLLQLSLSWMFERTEQRPTSWNNPTQAHNLSISAFSHSACLPIKSADHYRHGNRRLGEVIKLAFRTAGYQKVTLVERVYFTSKVNLALYRVKVKGLSGFKMVWFSLLISLSSSLSDRANLSN